MCTLLIAPRVWPGTRLVVAANRDELYARPASPPRVWEQGDRRFFAPRDDVAGGSWIGVAESGLFVGVTNRSIGGGPSLISPNRRSRGALVLDALGCATVEEALEVVRRHGPEAHNPFHLALADAEQARVIWSDGWTLHEEPLVAGAVHPVTERSYGAAPSKRDEFLVRQGASMVDRPEPTPERWRRILGLRFDHDSDDPRASFDDVCVAVPDWGYGTRSSTWVRIADDGAVRYATIEAPPTEAEFTELTGEIPWAGGSGEAST